MNIVILTDSYYPDMSATSACIDKYIQKLKYKHSVDVVCPISRAHFKPLNDPYLQLHFVSNLMWFLRMKCKDNILENKYKRLSVFLLNIFRIRSLLLSPFCYPTIMKWQIKAFVKKLDALYEERKFDLLISVSDPITTAFACRRFKKEHPEVKWITYFTDPFTFQPSKYRYVFFKGKRKKRNYINEKAIYDASDINLFTEELYQMAIHEFNQPLHKTYKIKYILSKIDVNLNYKCNNKSSKIKLIYAGMLFKDRRNPCFMLSVISRIEEVMLDMFIPYCNCDSIISKYLSSSIKRFMSVSRERYNEMICMEYDILVNIGNNFSLQIPSKLYELLSTGKPILNFYQIKDSQYEMVEKYPLGLNIEFNDPNAVEKVRDFCLRMKGKKITFEEVEHIYPENTLSSQLALFESLIN